jgi:hypothetical protein|tara:strand:- start:2866 stop:3420 length:555 start_codon:yes stop_codon:yes gene_type:complete
MSIGTFSMEEYIELFKNPVKVSINKVEDRAMWMAEGIYDNIKSRKGRDWNKVYWDTLGGVVCEEGVAALCGELNTQEFDVTDRSTYGWDVMSKFGHKIEVKRHKEIWYSFYQTAVNTLHNSIEAKAFEYIVTASYEKFTDHYLVRPRLIIDPLTFRYYTRKSQYSTGLYYDHYAAKGKNQCIIF